MASPEVNRIRQSLGMEPEPPQVYDLPYLDPQTPAELAANAVVVLHNRAEIGDISDEEAYMGVHAIGDTEAEMGDGWHDRYGPPPEY